MMHEKLDLITNLVNSLNELSSALDRTEASLKQSNNNNAYEVLTKIKSYREAITKQRTLIDQLNTLSIGNIDKLDVNELLRVSNLIAQIAIMIREDALECITSIIHPTENVKINSEDLN